MKPKPKVFIGSSKEKLETALKLKEAIQIQTDPIVWNETGVFRASRTNFQELERFFRGCDFCLFLFADDDVACIRGRPYRVVRDNVLFEFGLASGVLGQDSVYIVVPPDCIELPRFPTDLNGIIVLEDDVKTIKEWSKSFGGRILAQIADMDQNRRTWGMLIRSESPDGVTMRDKLLKAAQSSDRRFLHETGAFDSATFYLIVTTNLTTEELTGLAEDYLFKVTQRPREYENPDSLSPHDGCFWNWARQKLPKKTLKAINKKFNLEL